MVRETSLSPESLPVSWSYLHTWGEGEGSQLTGLPHVSLPDKGAQGRLLREVAPCWALRTRQEKPGAEQAENWEPLE